MKSCPFCGERLNFTNYTTYWDPPEWYERCLNPKCGKYEHSYFYYDGYTLRLDKWVKNKVADESKEFKEFILRLRYQKRKKYKAKGD